MNYTNEQRRLANEMADALQDRKSISQYLHFAATEDETFLREMLAYVLSKPDAVITTSRAALFRHIITSNAKSKGFRA